MNFQINVDFDFVFIPAFLSSLFLLLIIMYHLEGTWSNERTPFSRKQFRERGIPDIESVIIFPSDVE